MSIVHFTTEVTGGAGALVANVHRAMLSMGIKSTLITREATFLQECTVVKPFTHWQIKLRSLFSRLSVMLNLFDPKYALFGIQRSPITFQDLKPTFARCNPEALIFYWTSYFIDYKLILEVKRAYPKVDVFFICLDEAFLTGGCHYSWGCERYQDSCLDCPATWLPNIKSKINRDFESKIDILARVAPLIIYPSTKLKTMGLRSSALKKLDSHVIPLGALYRHEVVDISALGKNVFVPLRPKKLKLLVRSSVEYRKGCDLFLSALSIVQSQILDLNERLKVVSIGDDFLSESNIANIVDYENLGFVDRDVLLASYRDVDALLISSREDSGPLMINECVAAGVFVISTPVGVATDLIISDAVGIVTKTISGRAIADALVDFLDISDRIQALTEVATDDSLTFEGYSLALVKLVTSAKDAE